MSVSGPQGLLLGASTRSHVAIVSEGSSNVYSHIGRGCSLVTTFCNLVGPRCGFAGLVLVCYEDMCMFYAYRSLATFLLLLEEDPCVVAPATAGLVNLRGPSTGHDKLEGSADGINMFFCHQE